MKWKSYTPHNKADAYEQMIVYNDGYHKVSLNWYMYDFSDTLVAPWGTRYEMEIYIPEELSPTETTLIIHSYTYFDVDDRKKATDDAIMLLTRIAPDLAIDWESNET